MPHQRSWALLLLFVFSSLFFNQDVRGGTATAYSKTVESYTIPDVTLVNQDGVKISLKKILSSDKPVLVDFVYTTCTTICPVLSANFANFQRKLGPEAEKVQLVSLSIDPENDTPKVMKEYLRRYQAKKGWDFLTGKKQDMDRVIRAFNAIGVYSTNKMDHYPLILIKSPSGNRWVRIYGLIGTTELTQVYEGVQK